MYCIYVFSDEYGVPMYVGKAKNFNVRLKQHLNRDRFRYKSHFYNWLNKQIAFNKEFFVDVLEEVNDSNWKEREQYWIKHIKDNGYELTNMTDGGDGNNNQVFTKIARKRMSKAHIGHIVTRETRLKISNSHKGKKLSDKTKRKLSEHFKGKKCPEIVKIKLSKKVWQYDLNNNFIKEFKSLTEASNYLNCRKSTLANGINRNKNGKFKGYLWKYSNQ